MATDPKANGLRQVDVDTLERQYVLRALDVLKAQLKRGRTNMVDGSELHRYATAEIARVDVILEKFR